MIYLSDVVPNVLLQALQKRDIYLSGVGSATLTLELKDAETSWIIPGAVDTRAADSFDGNIQYTNSVTAWSKIRQLAPRWGHLIQQNADQLAAEI